MTSWRFIDTGPMDGPTNMAVDEALLLSFDPASSAPVLRLYGWSPPALSIGRFQDAREVLDLESCNARNVPVVRRITGGGVIFHADELTYSIVCAPHHIPPASSIKESFRVLTSFLLRFYEKLGLSACYAVDAAPSGERLGERTAFCFAGKESYDILINGRKIGGNAQRRLKNVIFQHGSIPLVNRAVEGAGFLRSPPARIGEETASLNELGACRDDGLLRREMGDAFRETLGAELRPTTLTPAEELAVAELKMRKYDCPKWNHVDEEL
ncbi:MAG: lipoate--protein ligase family protein [Geobacter sp.]|nr:lipoate--protein ligase family protein [Geobacter sp.]